MISPPAQAPLPPPTRPGAPCAAARAAAAAVGGYAWWYLEVHDEQGRFGLTLIVFAGSVFSPRYAARLRAGEALCGLDVPAVNFSLYERKGGAPPRRRAWVMNEYPRAALSLDADAVRVANTAVCLPAAGPITIELDEDTTRFFGRRGPRVRGRITVAPLPPPPPPLGLGESADGAAHFWQPLAPRAAATVELRLGPRQLQFTGPAYLDRNYGSGRLEDTFSHWGWAHGFPAPPPAAGDPAADAALIVYNAVHKSGQSRQLCVRYGDSAHPPEVLSSDHAPARGALTQLARDLFWLPVPRAFTAGPYTCSRLLGGTLEDTPFYARFAVRIAPTADPATAAAFHGVGEYLDLERFRRRSLQYLLRYKTRSIGAVPEPGGAP